MQMISPKISKTWRYSVKKNNNCAQTEIVGFPGVSDLPSGRGGRYKRRGGIFSILFFFWECFGFSVGPSTNGWRLGAVNGKF